jgi:hypothetical protein
VKKFLSVFALILSVGSSAKAQNEVIYVDHYVGSYIVGVPAPVTLGETITTTTTTFTGAPYVTRQVVPYNFNYLEKHRVRTGWFGRKERHTFITR